MFLELAVHIALSCSSGTSSSTPLEGGRIVYSAHVSGSVCRIEGRLAPRGSISAPDDVVVSDWKRGGNKFSCEPMVPGETYTMAGATGVVSGVASDRYANIRSIGIEHVRIVEGLAVPGMSGGPVYDKDGVVFGVVSSRNVEIGATFVKELADTEVCK